MVVTTDDTKFFVRSLWDAVLRLGGSLFSVSLSPKTIEVGVKGVDEGGTRGGYAIF